MPSVDAVHRGLEIAILDNGEQLLVTNWIDERGDDCSAKSAVAAVAGPDAQGVWYSIDLSEFVEVVAS